MPLQQALPYFFENTENSEFRKYKLSDQEWKVLEDIKEILEVRNCQPRVRAFLTLLHSRPIC